MQREGRAVAAYRTIYFLPVVTGFASAALLWAWLSNVDNGLFSPLAQMIAPQYSDAMQMALQHHDAATISQQCGISRAEAELVVALVRNRDN